MKFFSVMFLAMGLTIAGAAMAQGTPTTTTKPAMACCGDACSKMGAGCCKLDAAGKPTCTMGGTCCLKPAAK